MPSKNVVKQYIKGGIYHIYNRGVEKRTIFQDEEDYAVFLRFLKEYLLPPNHPDLEVLRQKSPRRIPINCHQDIELLSYCLMPNHFHLFVRQKSEEGLKGFMRALLTSYSIYFNSKYERVGPLFQGRYRAVLVQSDPYLLHLSRYIHLNPKELRTKDGPLYNYPYSSYPIYLGRRKCEWVNEKMILDIFGADCSKSQDLYRDFVEDDADSEGTLGDLVLEE